MANSELKNGMPIQKVSTAKKTKSWFIESAKAAYNVAMMEGDYGRKTYSEKIELYDLYDGIIDESKMEASFNTLGIPGAKFAPKFQHYPLMSPRIDLLKGELTKREFEYTIVSTNPNAISAKLNSRKQEFVELYKALVLDENADQEYIQARLEEFQQSDPRSLVEIQVDELLQYYSLFLDFKSMDEELFKDYIIVGEKIGCVELVNGKPIIRACDTLTTLTARDGGSKFVKDAEIVCEVSFYPLGKVLEEYYDDLSEADLNKLIGGDSTSTGSGFNLNGDTDTLPTLRFNSMEDLATFTNGDKNVSMPFDTDGNVRVVKIKWKGYRPVYRLRSYNNGELDYRFMSEGYKADKSKGEELEKKWFTEWHETTLIGSETWVRMKICDLQFRSYSNPFESKSGYFGSYNITASGKARSLMDRGKSLSYYYDMVFARLEDMLSKNIGKVIELDMAKMPENWNPKLWMYYLKAHNVAVVNSFKAGDKGIAQGKLAGNYNTTGRGIDMELGNSIMIYVNILAMIESTIAKITGISDQRLGQISARELVGNVERSTVQSNHITESYFNDLDATRMEYHSLFMDASRFAHAEDKTLLQYAKDDKQLVTISIDGTLLSHEDLGIFPVDNTKNTNFASMLRNAIQQQFASGNGDVSALIASYSTNSMAKLKTLHEDIQKSNSERQQAMMKQQSDLEKAAKLEVLNAEMARDKAKFDHEKELLEMKLHIEQLLIDRDKDNDGIADNIQYKIAEINAQVKREEISMKERIENKKISSGNKTTSK